MTTTSPASRPVRRRRRVLLVIGAVVAVVIVAAVTVVAMNPWLMPWMWGSPTPTIAEDGSVRDDFDGAAGDRPAGFWNIQTGGGGWGNEELQEYTSDAVALDGEGNLAITATIPRDGSTPTSGRVTAAGSFSFETGTVSARIKLPDGTGLLPAFWLLGDATATVGWPAGGEIDVVETPSTASASHHSVHGPSVVDGTWRATQGVRHETPLSDDFHVYTVEKSPGRLVILLDDEIVLDVSEDDVPDGGTWVFDAPFHPIFTLAVGGNWPGDPDETTPETATMLIDWISYSPDLVHTAP